jgi:hypothetical protein
MNIKIQVVSLSFNYFIKISLLFKSKKIFNKSIVESNVRIIPHK